MRNLIKLSTWRQHAAVRMHPRRYDQLLANGSGNEPTGALALHASRITSQAERDALRLTIDCVPSRFAPHTNSNLGRHLMDSVKARLSSPDQVTATGMARLRLLILSWDSPYHDGDGDDEAVRQRLMHVLSAL